jgi:hypothetical protein
MLTHPTPASAVLSSFPLLPSSECFISHLTTPLKKGHTLPYRGQG